MSDDTPHKPEIPCLSAVQEASGRWGAIARRLGLLAISRKGLLGERVRMLVGEREGFLVLVTPSFGLNTSSVDVLVRYPQGHTVRGFREDLALKLRRRRRKHLLIGDGSVLQRLPYTLVPPSARTIERAMDDLVAGMKELVRPVDRLCEGCGTKHDLGLFLADGIPGVYCEPCIHRFVSDEAAVRESFHSAAPDYGRGLGIGSAAAVAFGLVIGPLAAPVLVHGGSFSPLLVTPFFLVAGYLTSAFASRGFVGSSFGSFLLKLPMALLGMLVTQLTLTAVARMTVEPAEWNLVFMYSTTIRAVTSAPILLAVYAAAAILGWLAESTVWAVGRRRPKKGRTRIERIERDAVSGAR